MTVSPHTPDRLREAADIISETENDFNMAWYLKPNGPPEPGEINVCHTSGCLAGSIFLNCVGFNKLEWSPREGFFADETPIRDDGIAAFAREWLGIGVSESLALFTGPMYERGLPAEDVAEVIRLLAKEIENDPDSFRETETFEDMVFKLTKQVLYGDFDNEFDDDDFDNEFDDDDEERDL